MNPPLRAEADRQAVIAALLDGTIDCIATDHAPHAKHEKEVEFDRAPNGITGLETALGLALRVLYRDHGMSLSRVLALLTSAPATIVKLTQAGSLTTGQWADAVIFDPAAEWNFQTAASRSKSKNTPFDRAKMLGRIHATIVAGRIVFQQNPK
jgi:dihydroorotase